MSTNPVYEQQLYREHVSSLFTPLSYDEQSRMFYTSDNYIAFGWISNPIGGANDQIAEKLNMLLSMQYPPSTVISLSCFASPDIDAYIAHMLDIRRAANFGGHPVLEQAILEKAEFLQGGTKRRLNDRLYGVLRDVVISITCKVPASKGSLPSDKDWRQAGEHRTALEKGLEALGLAPLAMTQSIYLHLIGSMLNWGSNASWRNGGPAYDPSTLLNRQVVDFDTDLRVHENGLQLGKKHVRVLSPKRYPDFPGLAAMHLMVGDVMQGVGRTLTAGVHALAGVFESVRG